MRGRKLTQEQVERIRTRASEGATALEIAEEMHLCYRTVLNVANSMGIHLLRDYGRNKGAYVPTPDEIQASAAIIKSLHVRRKRGDSLPDPTERPPKTFAARNGVFTQRV